MTFTPQQSLLSLPFIPLLGALFVYLTTGGSNQRQVISGWIASIFALLSFIVVTWILFPALTQNGPVSVTGWEWFAADQLKVNFAFRFDHLTAVMCLVITGVGSLIHIYAIGYMAHDENRARFFTYLNMFLFAMLLLVLGDNLLVLFVGWEGVGLCSYLLIGFWYKDMANAVAGQKAFVVNRIGDAGFLLGIFVLFWSLHTVNFVELGERIQQIPAFYAALAALLLFVGAAGKSAQFPLYVWLPDAMAGPTPVSALIHAATMVTAGVYMITRLHFLYAAVPGALVVVAIIGTFTALFAATIALVQTDIKRVLAYSTVSQLGFMFMALGAGAFSNGIFHVVTHAFFKACLFMAAGSVIVGCHHEQDMRQFGGLRRLMPATFTSYLLATLAIAGIPFTSGFYSKDQILWTVFSSPHLAQYQVGGIELGQALWGVGVFTAFLTAFYMTRSLMLTFFGEYRGHAHPHESPKVMTLPILVLALLSIVAGFLWSESFLHFLGDWTRIDMQGGHDTLAHNETYHHLELLSGFIACLGVALAALIYSKFPRFAQRLVSILPGLNRTLVNKWYVDDLYHAAIVRPLRAGASFLFRFVDRLVIDGAVNGTGVLVEANGEILSRAHTGRINSYVFWMFFFSSFFLIFWLLL